MGFQLKIDSINIDDKKGSPLQNPLAPLNLLGFQRNSIKGKHFAGDLCRFAFNKSWVSFKRRGIFGWGRCIHVGALQTFGQDMEKRHIERRCVAMGSVVWSRKKI